MDGRNGALSSVGTLEISSGGRQRGETAWRAVAVVLFVVLAFGCAVMIVSMVDISRTPTCHNVQFNGATPNGGQCFSGSSLQKAVSLVLGFSCGALAAGAGLFALLFSITGRRGRFTAVLAGAAITLGVLSVVIGSI
jgi:hypothetical protein